MHMKWWVAWAVVALLWLGHWRYNAIDWESMALGGLTVGLLVMWAEEMTGGVVPASWRRKPPSDTGT